MNEFHVMNALDSTGQLISVKPLRKEHFNPLKMNFGYKITLLDLHQTCPP